MDGDRSRDRVSDVLSRDIQLEFKRLAEELGEKDGSLDLFFLAYLRVNSRFGFFRFGPVTIDVHLIEDIVARTGRERLGPVPVYGDDMVRFSRVLMEEMRRSGRRRADELTYLLAFMRSGEGLPARVFGELGVTAADVEAYARQVAQGEDRPDALERLYSPEEAADYLGVHVQTVRTWIRSGRLPASRLAGQRALRIRASDIAKVLEPVDPSSLE